MRRGQAAFVNNGAVREDLLDLDILIEDPVGLLPSALEELNPDLYRGARPPQRSCEATTKGRERYAFTWNSHMAGCVIFTSSLPCKINGF